MMNIDCFYKKLPQPIDKNTVFCLYARNGLFKLAQNIKKNNPKKSKFLIPSYSCGDEIETLIRAGFNTVSYGINNDLQIDIDDLQNKLSEDAAGILIVHYFGFPQKKIASIKKLADKSNCFLIEDCAHALGSSFNNIPLGKYGHGAIFSLRKFISIPHGGAVIINNHKLKGVDLIKPSDEAANLDQLVFLNQKYKFFKPGTPIEEIYAGLGLKINSHHGPRLDDFGGYELGISDQAKLMIYKHDWKENVNNRRKCFKKYLKLAKEIDSDDFRPMFKQLDSGVVPLSFPVIVNNSLEFHEKLKRLNWDNSIPFWSYFHKYIDWSLYPQAAELKKRIICFPLNNFDYIFLKKTILSIVK